MPTLNSVKLYLGDTLISGAASNNAKVYLGDMLIIGTVEPEICYANEILQRTISVPYVNDRITSIPQNKFNQCRYLPKVDFAKVSHIAEGAFNNTGPDNVDGSGLVTVILRNTETVCALQGTGVFGGMCPINQGLGYIYVPKTMADGSDGVAAYKNATNWAPYANQIRAIEDYPEICGGA